MVKLSSFNNIIQRRLIRWKPLNINVRSAGVPTSPCAMKQAMCILIFLIPMPRGLRIRKNFNPSYMTGGNRKTPEPISNVITATHSIPTSSLINVWERAEYRAAYICSPIQFLLTNSCFETAAFLIYEYGCGQNQNTSGMPDLLLYDNLDFYLRQLLVQISVFR